MLRVVSRTLGLSLALFVPSALANTSIDHVHGTSATLVGVPGDILTEGTPPGPPAPPVVAIAAGAIGLVPGDEIDALSWGDDPIAGAHDLTFSVAVGALGALGSGVAGEVALGTPPSAPVPLAIPKPPEAAGDLFIQAGSFTGPCTNVLAPAGLGYGAGSGTGDEFNATWVTPAVLPAPDDDLDAFDYTDPATPPPGGVYFSLAPGSPSLIVLGATAGDILWSPLGGGPPVIAVLLGVGPATDVALGIAGANLDALNLVAAGPGLIAAGPVGPSSCSPAPAGTHVVEYSVAPGGPFAPSDVLVRMGPALAAIKVPAPGLGLLPTDDLDALEAFLPLPKVPTAGLSGLALLGASLLGIGLAYGVRRARR
jgi:hypothetical protein